MHVSLAWLSLSFCSLIGAPAQERLQGFVDAARDRHGAAGEQAALFLLEHMPPGDRSKLEPDFLIENLDLAFMARAEFAWAAQVPTELFWNDVLPYAVFDEPRDPWRAQLLELARPIVAQSSSAGAAAQALNQQLFTAIAVHYNTGRKRANQSLRESQESGQASCTGLSIVLVEACRAVGIPARAVGTPAWANGRGNHTWVEIWDGAWHCLGADEFDPAGLDRGWFLGEAARAQAEIPEQRIYASSWRRLGLCFPMVWSPGSEAVAAVDVTARYAAPAAAPSGPQVGVRVYTGGQRVQARLVLIDGSGRALASAQSKAGTADLNDLPSFELSPKARASLRIEYGGAWREHAFEAPDSGTSTLDLQWSELAALDPTLAALESWLAQDAALRGPAPDLALTRQQANLTLARLAGARELELRLERRAEREAQALEVAGKTLRWKERRFGDAPPGKRSLWISMHGGGGAPPEVNDQQWENQIQLYQPAEGFYVAPRAPTDTWNLWHEGHIDGLFDRLIEDFVALEGVDPERVYLLGYSAGGDGVWQLAPRLADRFAAVAMMAGHPNEAGLDGLLNLPFGLFMGAEDQAYGRNQIARERAASLVELAATYPGGYVHLSRIYPGLGHWMQRQDAEALPWMAGFRRQTWPAHLIWLQDDVLQQRFYWLGLAPEGTRAGQRIDARIVGQTLTITCPDTSSIHLRLADQLLDIDQPIEVLVNGRSVYSGRVQRCARELWRSLLERADPSSAAPARLELSW